MNDWLHFEAYFWNVSNLISETIGLNERVARTLEWMTDRRRRGSCTKYTNTHIHIHKYKYTNTQILKYKNTNKSYKNTKVQQITMKDWPQEEARAPARSAQPAARSSNWQPAAKTTRNARNVCNQTRFLLAFPATWLDSSWASSNLARF